MSDIDPTFYGSSAPKIDHGAAKRKKLEKRANAHEIVTGNDMIVELRKYIEARHKMTMDILLDDKTLPEDIPLVRAKAQVHKEYKDILDRLERSGANAIRELRANE